MSKNKKDQSSSEESSESSEEEAPKKSPAPAKKTEAPKTAAKKEASESESESESESDEKPKAASPKPAEHKKEEQPKSPKAEPKKEPAKKKESSSEESGSESESEEEKPTKAPQAKAQSPVASPKASQKKKNSDEEPETPKAAPVAAEDETAKKAKEERKKRREELERAAQQLKESKIKEARDIAEKVLDDKLELKAKDVVPPILSLMDDPANRTDVALIQGGFLVIRHCEDPAAFKNSFRENSGMSIAVQLLGSKEDGVRRATVRFLGDTITKCGSQENIANAESFASAGGIPLIVKLLSDKEQHIQSMCAGVIRVLSGYEGRTQGGVSFQEEFRNAGAVAPLVSLLQSDQADMIRQAAGAIRGLAEGNKTNRDAFVDAGTNDILFKHLSGQPDPKVQAHVLSTIYTLTIGSSKAAEHVKKNDQVKILVKEFKSDFPEKHELILGIWKNICLDNVDMQNYLRTQGVLDIVLETVTKHVPEKTEGSTKTATPGQALTPKEKVQKSSCSCLAALTAGNTENVTVAVNAGMLEKLAKMLEVDCDPVVSRALSAERSLITKNKTNQNKLLEMRAIARVLELALSKSTEVRDQAVSVLAQCLDNEKIKRELVSKALPTMLQVIDPIPVPDALAVLQTLLEEDAIKASVSNNRRALTLFVSFLDEKNERVLTNDCSVISSLSVNNKPGAKAIVSLGAAPKLVKLLGTSNSVTVQQYAAYAVWALCKSSGANKTAFGKSNALTSLVQIIKEDKASPALKEYALGAIYALTANNALNKKHVLAANGIDAIVPLVKGSNSKIKVNAAKAILAVCENNSMLSAPSTKEAVTHNQDRAHGAIPDLVKLLKTEKFTSQSAAAGALYAISAKNPKNQNAAREHGALPTLVVIVKSNYKEYVSGQKNSSQGEAIKWAVIAIGALAHKNPANQNALIKEGAVGVLEPLRDSPIEALQREGVIALNSLGAKKTGSPAPSQPKKAEPKKEEPKKEEPKKEEPKKAEPKKEATKKEDSDSESESGSDSDEKKPAPKKEEAPKSPKAEPKKEEAPKSPKAEPKKEAPKKEESESESESGSDSDEKKPAPKKEEPKKPEPAKQDSAKKLPPGAVAMPGMGPKSPKAEPKKEEPKKKEESESESGSESESDD